MSCSFRVDFKVYICIKIFRVALLVDNVCHLRKQMLWNFFDRLNVFFPCTALFEEWTPDGAHRSELEYMLHADKVITSRLVCHTNSLLRITQIGAVTVYGQGLLSVHRRNTKVKLISRTVATTPQQPSYIPLLQACPC